MINILIGFQSSRFTELTVCGHGSDPSGVSLACNSVSILTQTFEESVLQLVNKEAFDVFNSSGKSKILRNGNIIGTEQNLILDCLVKSYVIGIRRVQLSFPDEIVLSLGDRPVI